MCITTLLEHDPSWDQSVDEVCGSLQDEKIRHFVFRRNGSGTTSHYGVSRVVTDMLMYQPDFVVVDFSVNDDPNEFFQETYEGMIRRMLMWSSKPAVLLLNNVFYDTGKNAQEYHNRVGDWYHLPHVSIKDTVWRRSCHIWNR